MGIMKDKHIDYLDQQDSESDCPKHVIDERKIEGAIERMYRSEQQDMFDDPDMNWSGLR